MTIDTIRRKTLERIFYHEEQYPNSNQSIQAMIIRVDPPFSFLKVNPFKNGISYSSDWIMLQLSEDMSFRQFTIGNPGEIFRLIITKSRENHRSILLG